VSAHNQTLNVSLGDVVAKVDSHYGPDLAMAVKAGCACVFRPKSASIPLANRHSFRSKSALVPTQIDTPV